MEKICPIMTREKAYPIDCLKEKCALWVEEYQKEKITEDKSSSLTGYENTRIYSHCSLQGGVK